MIYDVKIENHLYKFISFMLFFLLCQYYVVCHFKIESAFSWHTFSPPKENNINIFGIFVQLQIHEDDIRNIICCQNGYQNYLWNPLVYT